MVTLEPTVDELRVCEPEADAGGRDAPTQRRRERRCRTFRLRRDAAGLERGDLVIVIPGARPEGGEFVIDHHFRLGRHGGGPVWGVVVGMVRRRRREATGG
jgi:hypothetical protein